jgi:hypothetical protein
MQQDLHLPWILERETMRRLAQPKRGIQRH